MRGHSQKHHPASRQICDPPVTHIGNFLDLVSGRQQCLCHFLLLICQSLPCFGLTSWSYRHPWKLPSILPETGSGENTIESLLLVPGWALARFPSPLQASEDRGSETPFPPMRAGSVPSLLVNPTTGSVPPVLQRALRGPGRKSSVCWLGGGREGTDGDGVTVSRTVAGPPLSALISLRDSAP